MCNKDNQELSIHLFRGRWADNFTLKDDSSQGLSLTPWTYMVKTQWYQWDGSLLEIWRAMQNCSAIWKLTAFGRLSGLGIRPSSMNGCAKNSSNDMRLVGSLCKSLRVKSPHSFDMSKPGGIYKSLEYRGKICQDSVIKLSPQLRLEEEYHHTFKYYSSAHFIENFVQYGHFKIS